MWRYQDTNMSMMHHKPLITILFGASFFLALWFLPSAVFASTNISAATTSHWAWNDTIGWINFYTTNNITVNASQLTGYASSSVGYVVLDCGTAPGGANCSSNYKVTNDGAGNLGGWAWNDTIGWITFFWGDATANHSATSTYTSVCTSYGSYCGVYIDAAGNFRGYAWNDAVGWISFDCLDIGVSFCNNTSNYEVATSWAPVAAVGTLDSTTFDTGIASGTELNSVIWHGSLNGLPLGAVGFQFAASTNTSGPWLFTGPDGTASSTYSGNPDASIPITNYPAYAGYRYFRYRVILTTNSSQSLSPKVTGVSVDWSP